mmetsp:Transcript_20213/g.26710  ORF Transcript_20213/g.26710 Transcript_20213/m.26710 type:complete len:395 (-) Transcript_20213:460-1644(-)
MAVVHQVFPIYSGISCHAWNSDQSMVAICPNNNEMHIYGNCQSDLTSSWSKLHVLDEHDLAITGMDWSGVNGRLVTCSADRNAFVWTQEEDQGKVIWRPSLVILNIDRAATDVRWSPNGLKFACASGAKAVPVCFYESESDWWVSKQVKKHKSTILALAWHPGSQVIATGCCDFRARLCSVYLENIDDAPIIPPCYTQALPFGEVYGEFVSSAWVTSLAWSPSGNSLVFTAQDSTIHFISMEGAEPLQQTVRLSGLPYNSSMFLSERSVVAGGHDYAPFLFTSEGPGLTWSLHSELQDKGNLSPKSEAPKKVGAGISDKLAMFQSKITRGQEEAPEVSREEDSGKLHESAITCMQKMTAPGSDACRKFCTSALDGRLVIWNLNLLELDLSSLSL